MSIMYDGKIAFALDAFREEHSAWRMVELGDGRRWQVDDMLRRVPCTFKTGPKPLPGKVSYVREVFASKDAAKDFIKHQAMAAAIKAHNGA